MRIRNLSESTVLIGVRVGAGVCKVLPKCICIEIRQLRKKTSITVTAAVVEASYALKSCLMKGIGNNVKNIAFFGI